MRPGRGILHSLFFSILFTLSLAQALAQSAEDLIRKGDRYLQRKDYPNALSSYREALLLEPDNARVNFNAGLAYLNEERYAEALTFLEKAYRLQSDVDSRIDYHLAMAYEGNHQYADAIAHYQAFGKKYATLKKVAEEKIAGCKLADSLMRIPVGATVLPLQELNTPFAEFSPLLTPDGNSLLFTSNRSEDEYEIKSSTNFEDVYVSDRQGRGWGSAKKIGEPVNVRVNEAAVGLSPDGNTMLLYYGEGNGDLYAATREGDGWSQPVALNRFVNHPHFRESSACISPDGKKLFFASNRAGGKGGYDIYVCEMGADGQWGRPSNLGSPINTRGDEEFPFMHADGETLYFSSNGHATLGEYDIYASVLVNNTWSAPRHLGYPINTRGLDGGFILSKDGHTGYFFSRRSHEAGNTDLFVATLSDTSPGDTAAAAVKKPEAEEAGTRRTITLLKGTVIDAKDTRPLEATVRLVDNASKILVSATKTGPSGTFQIEIPQGGNYGLTTDRPGYLFNSMNFIVPAFDKYQELETHILMVKAEVGSKVVLKNIFFDVNEAELKPESLSELENIRDLLQRNPQWRIQINGHTDNVGKPAANMALSLRRAQAVVRYLVEAGINPDRLEARGYGSERPLVSNDDEKDGRQINRRTEIEIIE